jgi:hypothetical protein
MPSKVGGVARYDDFVAFTRADLVIASRAAVRLRCLVRLHVGDVDVVVGC